MAPPNQGPDRPPDAESLKAKRVAVIGATGGIGFATTEALLAAGACVLGTGRSSGGLRRLTEAGAVAQPLDLSDPYAAQTLAFRAEEEFGGGLDGLVLASGGYGPIAPIRDLDLGALQRSLHDNLLAWIGVIQACAGVLDAGDSPALVLIAGGGATGPLPNYSAYALAKVSIVRLVENLAIEEPAWRVNAVAPGFVATGIHSATFAAGPEKAGSFFERTKEQIEKAVSPTIAASLVRFLVSDEGRGISGRLISAVWDPWRDVDQRRLLTEDLSFGRLRRIDRQRYFEADTPI